MVTTRNSRADVIAAAGRLFAERGYHGTSMRDLGRELGMLGSSLYAHVDSKQDLLVEVVEQGARLFQESAASALAVEGTARDRLRALIRGHVGVVLANQDVVRTFLNEARMLDDGHRSRVIAARDAYEQAFRDVLGSGIGEQSFREDVDPKIASILILSILNALERWYRPDGDLDSDALARSLVEFVESGLT
ncbi:MAG TPA: TetR/AcrR family transcriptional regulator [Acidimicrobiia bacterium]|nr:TetR/AcrR family transcriptional regulator [Acidimicrobiia bacterium]